MEFETELKSAMETEYPVTVEYKNGTTKVIGFNDYRESCAYLDSLDVDKVKTAKQTHNGISTYRISEWKPNKRSTCVECGKPLAGVPLGWSEKNVCSGRCWGYLYGETDE